MSDEQCRGRQASKVLGAKARLDHFRLDIYMLLHVMVVCVSLVSYGPLHEALGLARTRIYKRKRLYQRVFLRMMSPFNLMLERMLREAKAH